MAELCVSLILCPSPLGRSFPSEIYFFLLGGAKAMQDLGRYCELEGVSK